MFNPILIEDLHYILTHTRYLWENLRHQRIFITGGTGFFGCWLLESFTWINDTLQLDAHAVVLTRNAPAFAKKCPHLYHHPALTFLEGDITNFQFPPGEFSHIIHGATDANNRVTDNEAHSLWHTIVAGTKRMLAFSAECHVKRFLLISSGAVYGKQSPQLTYLNEEHHTSLDLQQSSSFYALGKITAEHLACLFARQHSCEVTIARCFSFVGAYLPLDKHFAIGNFIHQRLSNTPIVVKGDGSSLRSYLYAADLTICLWKLLFIGKSNQPYNVGSDVAISIAELAYLIAEIEKPHLPVHIEQSPSKDCLATRYIPSVKQIQQALDLPKPINLENAILRTLKWNAEHKTLSQDA